MMPSLHFVVIFIVIFTTILFTSSTHAAVQDVVDVFYRLFPDLPKKSNGYPFDFALINNNASNKNNNNNGYADVTSFSGFLKVRATDLSMLSAGGYQFLKKHLKMQVTWGINGTGNSVRRWDFLTIPAVPTFRVRSIVPTRYALQPCTFGYSLAFASWHRWERELDWMSLHGINFGMMSVGSEYVTYKAYTSSHSATSSNESWKLSNLTDFESYFTGQAFLPWNRLGNIRGYANSPLTLNQLIQQRDLGRNIVKRMRKLGISPVLEGFSGFIPEIVAKRFLSKNPKSVSRVSNWNFFPANLTENFLLDPTDENFLEIGAAIARVAAEEFLSPIKSRKEEQEQEQEDEKIYYSADTFNEVFPKNTSAAYLSAASRAVITAMKQGNPKAKWLMQSWLFSKRFQFFWSKERVREYLSGISSEDLLILDLHSEDGALALEFDNFYGKSWIWCLLLDYGGRRGLFGNLTRVATGPLQDLVHVPNSTMKGIGLTPEAIDNNPVVFELLTDTFFSLDPISVKSWLNEYATQRYNLVSSGNQQQQQQHAAGLEVWKLLENSMYNQNADPISDIEHMPSIYTSNYLNEAGCPSGVNKAAELLLKNFLPSSSSKNNNNNNNNNQSVTPALLYDFVDIVRMSSVMFFSDLRTGFNNVLASKYWKSKIPSDFMNSTAGTMLSIISTLDALLATNVNFRLGYWLYEAEVLANEIISTSSASTSSITKNSLKQKILKNLQFNAKAQITTWGTCSKKDSKKFGPLNGCSLIMWSDYASKAFSGLYRTFYRKRWGMLFDLLSKSSSPSELSPKLWQFSEMNEMDIEWTLNFTTQQDFPPNPSSKESSLSNIAKVGHELLFHLTSFESEEEVLKYFTIKKQQQQDIKTSSSSSSSSLIQFKYDMPLWNVDVRRVSKVCYLLGKGNCDAFDTNGYLYYYDDDRNDKVKVKRNTPLREQVKSDSSSSSSSFFEMKERDNKGKARFCSTSTNFKTYVRN